MNDTVEDTDILKLPVCSLLRLELNAALLDTPSIHLFFSFFFFSQSPMEVTESNFCLSCQPEMFLIFLCTGCSYYELLFTYLKKGLLC